MNLLRTWKKWISTSDPAQEFAATIGVFDGVHRGHQYLISQLKAEAAERGLATLILTFRQHPLSCLRPGCDFDILTTALQKKINLEKMHCDGLVFLDFDHEMSLLSARDFMTALRNEYRVRLLLMGYDHHFGHDRSLSFDDYQAIGRDIGIDVVRAQPLIVDGEPVSSSRIRRLLAEGDVETANRLLGREYITNGVVNHGHALGRQLGFPTANIERWDTVTQRQEMWPRNGVYAVYATVAELGGQRFAGMANVGNQPTFRNRGAKIEVHLFDFNEDIYGDHIRVYFVARLRDERHFDSVEELARQIRRDGFIARQRLASQKGL